MRWMVRLAWVGLALCGIATALPAAAADATLVALSDIHLDPFTGTDADRRLLAADVGEWPGILAAAPAPVATFGSDANLPLLDAVLGDAARRVTAPDLVLFTGDALAHRFAERVRAVDPAAGDDLVGAVAAKTTAFVAGRIAAAFPGTPVLFALGNNDDGCGDYQLEPGSAYLARTFPVVAALVGAGRLEADAGATWRAGGYYAARHPVLPGTVAIVLNTVLWSPDYKDRCGGGDDRAPGDAMWTWLQARLAAAEAAGERVWLVSHVPAGIDAFATARTPAAEAACTAATVPLWREPYASGFAALIGARSATVTAAFAGHIHRDSWRLFAGPDGTAAAFESILPAISPVYGDAPAYQVFRFDRSSGRPTNKTTFAVANLPDAARGAPVAVETLYDFTGAYGVAAYDAAALAAVTAALRRETPERALFARFYGSGHGNDPATDWPVYACAPGAATAAQFNACRCGAP